MTTGTVLEGNLCYITFGFYDYEGNPVVPSSVVWWGHDKMSGTLLQDETAVSPAAQVTIEIPAIVNTRVDNTLEEETRIITVRAIYQDTKPRFAYFEYILQERLFGTT